MGGRDTTIWAMTAADSTIDWEGHESMVDRSIDRSAI